MLLRLSFKLEQERDNVKEYCVEYYSDVMGSGVRCFSTSEERDVWLMGISVDQFYLYEREKSNG